MKTSKTILGTLLMGLALSVSCKSSDDIDNDCDGICDVATAEAFNALQEAALSELTQEFTFNADGSTVTLTSENGVNIYINTSCLTQNGNAVSGNVALEFVELFDKGNMLVTNKPTMGIMPDGNQALLISGGEFYLNATQNGEALDTNCGFQMSIPAELTGGADNAMLLWEGIIDENGDLAWDQKGRDNPNGQGGVFVEGNEYYGFFDSFGWANVDRFYSDPRPKTTILVAVPDGYDNANSAVYISYDGEDTGLAKLDTYDTNTGLFSEHYGQIPIGLECHIIFATEEGDNWKYAIKPVTIVEDGIITFSEAETAVATEDQLTVIINNLP